MRIWYRTFFHTLYEEYIYIYIYNYKRLSYAPRMMKIEKLYENDEYVIDGKVNGKTFLFY